MLLALLVCVADAMAQAAPSTQPSPDELGAALATLGQWAMGLGGAGGVGAGGASLWLRHRTQQQVDAIAPRVDALDASITGIKAAIADQRGILDETRSAVAALSAPSEAAQAMRDRLTRLEAQHEANTGYLQRVDGDLESVRTLLIQAGGRRGD